MLRGWVRIGERGSVAASNLCVCMDERLLSVGCGSIVCEWVGNEEVGLLVYELNRRDA